MNSTIPADLHELKARFETWCTNRKEALSTAVKVKVTTQPEYAVRGASAICALARGRFIKAQVADAPRTAYSGCVVTNQNVKKKN